MIPQGTLLWPKEPIQFINPDTNRLIKINMGQSLWVTNPQHDQNRTKIVKAARSNSKIPFNFSFEDVNKYFTWSGA